MIHNNSYMFALLKTESRFSCLKAASLLGMISHDKLTRILTNNCQKQEIEIKSLPKGGRLIYDDTSINKAHSRNIS